LSIALIETKNQTIRYAFATNPVKEVPIINTPTKTVRNAAAITERVIVVESA